MAEFKVGGKVIALESHSQGAFKKGDVFIVRAWKINNRPCKCKCYHCGYYENTHVWWFDISKFAPLDDLELSETTYQDVMELVEAGELVANG